MGDTDVGTFERLNVTTLQRFNVQTCKRIQEKHKEHMSKKFWIKLYFEILDDDKLGLLPEYIKWRTIALFIVAGENGNDGLLPPVARLAWRLRLDKVKITETLSALSQVGVVHETPQGWVVTNFKKRQTCDSNERTKRYRERTKERHGDGTRDGYVTDDDSISISSSSSSSFSDSEERGVGGETPVPALPAVPAQAHPPPGDRVEQEFSAHFGSFISQRERERWQTLFEAIGFARLQEVATWAERREIHMLNRGALLDSLETAARKWIDNTPRPKGDNSEFFKNLAIASEEKK